MTLLAKICAHTQQICGLAWSPDDRYLATGGNDNTCLLFEMGEIVPIQPFDHAGSPVTPPDSPSQFSLGAFPYLALGTATRRLFRRRTAMNHFLPSWVKSSSYETPSHHSAIKQHGDTDFWKWTHNLWSLSIVKSIASCIQRLSRQLLSRHGNHLFSQPEEARMTTPSTSITPGAEPV